MKVKFWGVRGSIPCPGDATSAFGGNTSCVQVLDPDHIIILDAGTGIRELGLELMRREASLVVHLFVSHTHWDHIQGFPFFLPIFFRRHRLHVYGPRALGKSIRDVLLWQMQYSYFPVLGAELAADIRFRDLGEESFSIGDIRVTTHEMNHPIKVLAYKFSKGGKSVVYTGDNEPHDAVRHRDRARTAARGLKSFLKNADLVIADAQYTDAEYEYKKGWGHSTISQAVNLAANAGARKLALFHHEPTHTDADLRYLEKAAVKFARDRSRRMKVFMAREGEIVNV